MSDIRRIELDSTEPRSVRAIPESEFKIGINRLKELENLLPEILKLDYYSPVYQAWEPFIQSYLTSGNCPTLAKQWLPRLASKIVEFAPPECIYHDIMGEVLSMDRSHSSEIFEGYCWEDIVRFTSIIPKYIDNQKFILRYLFDVKNYRDMLTGMLAKSNDEQFSRNLPWAIYLYRHCMHEVPPITPELRTELEQQLRAYVASFCAAFDEVARFLGSDTEVYEWYSPKIKVLIANAWSTATDLTSRRHIISSGDVFSMPVWLSEQITDYLNTLPCVMTTPVTPQFMLDALEYAMSEEASASSHDLIYAFCIPKDYVRRLFAILSRFFWDVKEGTFVPYLINRVAAQYTDTRDSNPEAKTSEEYAWELASRGFPVDLGGESQS